MKITLSREELDERIDKFLKHKAKRFPELDLQEHAELPSIAARQSNSWRRSYQS